MGLYLEELEGDEVNNWREALGDEFETLKDNNVEFIPEDDWEEYAIQCAVDSGVISDEHRIYLDEEMWARDLSTDYSTVEVDGQSFYYRE